MHDHITHISERQLAEALALPDLTDAAYGPHCMQSLVADAIAVLSEAWSAATVVSRGERIVTLAENYDLLGYPSDGPARAARYTRYVDDARILRTQTSAAIPAALRSLAGGSRPSWCSPCRAYAGDGTASTGFIRASHISSTYGGSRPRP